MKSVKTNRKVLFLPLYNEDWASSKYRVYKHIKYLEMHGLTCKVIRPPIPQTTSRLSYYTNLFLNGLMSDVIVIQKKIFRLPLFRMLLLLKKKMIFDFDDAIYCYEKDLKAIHYILSRVNHILAADESLAVYARRYNKHVTVLPTPLESGHYRRRNGVETDNVIKIAWIGRPWNQHFLSDIEGVFEQLQNESPKIVLYIVSGQPFKFKNLAFPTTNIPWSEEAEEEILHTVDIGIVPLTDDEWSRGKCGYKALLYMSYGLPVIASPVGVKAVLIKNGINGILASTQEEWVAGIRHLAKDDATRRKLGVNGYETFISGYTYDVVSTHLARILETV